MIAPALQARIDEHARTTGLGVLPWLSALFVALAAGYLVAPPIRPGGPFAATLGGAAALLLGICSALRRLPVRAVHLLLPAAALVALCVALAFVMLTGDPAQSVTLAIALIGVGSLTLDVRGTALLSGIALAGWFVLARDFVPAVKLHWAINLGCAAVLAVLVTAGRRRSLRRQLRAEDALRESEGQLRALVEQTGMIPWEGVAGSFAFTYVGPQAERILGHPLAAWHGPTFWVDHVHPDDREAAMRACEEATARLADHELEYRFRAADGRWVWLHDVVTVSPSLEGPARVRGFLLDVTQRKRSEAATERAMHAAQAASHAKAEFLANMSHEIRTPLNGVIGMTDLLLGTELSKEQREYAETVRSSGEYLLGILNDILDFSKLEAGKLSIDRVSFDAIRAVEEVASLFAPRAEEKGLALALDLDPALAGRVLGDPGRLRQILSNFVGNALKFTERGHVLLGAERGEGERVRFVVEDTGIGIAPDKLSAIFEKFAQADSSTTRRFGGTGLGLAISKQLAELMRGSIGVESRPGEGSRFWLELDLPPDPGAGSASLRRGELDGLRAIVVFGEPIEARAATRWAEALGLRVESVRGSDAALLRLREAAATGDPFRVAFGVSPVDDARALASRVREEPALAAIPVVGCIAPGNPGEPAFDVTLTRPLRPSELLRAVSALHLPHREAEVVRDALPDRDAIARPNGFTARVLVAEDNPVNRKLAARLLAKLGCQVELAGDGLEALEAVTAGRFQLIFLDVQMPRMDGHQAARELQRLFARGAHPRVPVVAMTANALPGDREACLAAGMDDYLAKPLRARELEAMLAHWLEA